MKKHLYKYIITGLLLPSLGMAVDLTVHFTSPVIEGDDVEMTCSYDNIGDYGFDIFWKKDTVDEQITFWTFSGSKRRIVSNDPLLAFSSKFEYINQAFPMKSHKIKLLDADKKDESFYQCTAYISDTGVIEIYSSSSVRLDVVMDPCDNITCVNGECVRVPSHDSFDASCECSSDYTGDLCDARVSPCDEVDPCVNGNCMASEDYLSSLCECPAEYTGDFCEVQLPSTPVPTPVPTEEETSRPTTGSGYGIAEASSTTPDKGSLRSSACILTSEAVVIGACTAMAYIAIVW